MLTLFSLQTLVLVSYFFFMTRTSHASTLGSPTDPVIQGLLDQCLNNETIYNAFSVAPGFEFGRCPHLIDCIMTSSSEAAKAGMSAGSNIAALIPTMLALIGGSPFELVRLAFLSPFRALATCLFGVGLPTNLFAQLQRHPQPSSSAPIEFPASVHHGVLQFAFLLSVPRRRRTVVFRIALDVSILFVAAIMLWRNWRVGTTTMVTWRCEWRWLLFYWPFICIAWWLSAVGSLCGMARKIEVFRESDKSQSSWRALFMMSYSVRKESKVTKRRADLQKKETKTNARSQVQAPPVLSTPPDDDPTLIVRIEFRSEAHWRWWSTAVQAAAVAIYLYATFVLCSVLFLTGNEAIAYAVTMASSLSAIRIMTALI
ncbi:MAG: hypothetical protein M1830_006880 [Pleopsidium flavum]|nr:MAG: hypothetical protein M1830_006880 [Pleopsidium flavum]